MSADLHCHTRFSDGSVTVQELVLLAKQKGLKNIAITDHDTFAGVEQAVNFGKQAGVNVIPGAEISCFDFKRKRKVHLLCFMPDRTDKLSEILDVTNRLRTERLMNKLDKIQSLYPIPLEMIQNRRGEASSLYKQHVMRALMDAGYTDKVFGEIFQQLFHGRTGIAKVRFDYPDIFDAVKLVRESGGVAVLAHPAVYNSYELMYELIENGLDGIEVWYPRAKDTDEKLLGSLCDKHGLIKSGGTDFHGINTTNFNPIGTCTTSDEELAKIIALAESRKNR